MSLEKHRDLRRRTQDFALRILKMSRALPRNREADVIARQVLRSGMSVAANYRAAGQGRSKAEFIAKLGIVIEETDETIFWLEMLGKSGIVRPARLEALLEEANQLLAVFGASWRTARGNKNRGE
ncbi:MAG TPA: four helix bundle protein [Candidatus Acidoferrales bacterium]|nr:four helix bundle protein [Candidatus Acidoferrales bacterium]